MATYQNPYSNSLGTMPGQFNQFQQLQQMFPQPQGSVYSINSPLEIGNVPIGSTGLSVALCLGENLMYIKSFQNGSPVIMTYRILPHNADQRQTQTAPDVPVQTAPVGMTEEQANKLKQIDDRLAKIESTLNHNGGKFNELLQS